MHSQHGNHISLHKSLVIHPVPRSSSLVNAILSCLCTTSHCMGSKIVVCRPSNKVLVMANSGSVGTAREYQVATLEFGGILYYHPSLLMSFYNRRHTSIKG